MTSAARQARILTAVLLTGLGLFLAVRDGRTGKSNPVPPPAPQTTPQEAIYAMFDAARSGNVEEYAAQFNGAMASSIAQAIAEQGRARFAAYLEKTHGPVKGLAVDAPQQVSNREATARVEYVFADRNEAQLVHLERPGEGKAWKIARLDKVERVKTVVPYGTPAQ